MKAVFPAGCFNQRRTQPDGPAGRIHRSTAAIFFSVLLLAGIAKGETTNDLSDLEIQGRQLAQRILAQQPEHNYTNTGILNIRDGDGNQVKVPVEFEVHAGGPAWETTYSTRITNASPAGAAFGRIYFSQLTIIHSPDAPNVYLTPSVNAPSTDTNTWVRLKDGDIMRPFARSDFLFADLGLEFFHWPGQKVVKKEFHRQCPCIVLESTNPHPAPGGYSRVMCWVDEDSLGIVEAYAYDFKGKRLKNFYPKSLEKVNGQYQLKSMVMENLQTGSKSVLDFDLDK